MYYSQLGATADFEQQGDIINEGSTVLEPYGKYARDLRDRPRFTEANGDFEGFGAVGHPMVMGQSFKHPMSAMHGFFDDIGSAITNAVSSALPKAQTAATEALNKVAAGVATDVLAQPKVQAAVSDTVKTQATQALATKLQALPGQISTFWATNKKMILLGSAGVVGLFVAYKMFGKRR